MIRSYIALPLLLASSVSIAAIPKLPSPLESRPRITTSPVVEPTILVAERKKAKPIPRGKGQKQKGLDRIAARARGLVEPSRQGYVNAAQVYPFEEGAVYRLIAAPERVTDIMLEPGETLVAVAAGDTVRWTVGDTVSGSGAERRTHILIKPFSSGLSTNLIITTDRRTYHLAVRSQPGEAMAAIRWSYPADALLALRRRETEAAAAAPVAGGFDVEALNFDYRISGDDPPWRPLRAFDNGRQVLIEFPPSIAVGEAPPLFVLDEKGVAELVNYRVSGRYYVVDRLFDRAELRLGGKKQKIVRIVRSTKGKRL